MATKNNLTLADGQVAVTATEIIAGPSNTGARVNVTFANTGADEETLVLTFARAGGTARRLKRVLLRENEQCEIGGLPMNGDDSLKAATTTASVVDFIVSLAPPDAPLTFEIQDADGIRKNIGTLNEALFQGTYNEV